MLIYQFTSLTPGEEKELVTYITLGYTTKQVVSAYAMALMLDVPLNTLLVYQDEYYVLGDITVPYSSDEVDEEKNTGNTDGKSRADYMDGTEYNKVTYIIGLNNNTLNNFSGLSILMT